MATPTKKAGLGRRHGVVSELSAPLTVIEGHLDELKAASGRFNERLLQAAAHKPGYIQKIGIRYMRHIVFDDGRRLMWLTAFETDWDPYIDDALELIGMRSWVDWLQHTNEYSALGLDPDTVTNAEVKEFLQSVQVPAAAFFDSLFDVTMPEVRRFQQLGAAFEQVLEAPDAEAALRQPALAPLLEQAAG
ncbi:hypothetical protein ACIBL3_39015 [Kribbella sp. NPDC050124]|uniref:hypothetical protein n=1 Tax=Kribbella sp. NPDC050124 TaxID=3364114 RepID=UPI0037B365DE